MTAVTDERERVSDIVAIGRHFHLEDEAQRAIEEGLSIEAFRQIALDKVGSRSTRQGVINSAKSVGMSNGEIRRYSFVRALSALANPQNQQLQRDAAFEREASEAAAKVYGKETKFGSFTVPPDVLRAPAQEMMQRDLTVGTTTAGGYTVATDLLAGSFIDLLRHRMMVKRIGAMVLNDLNGDVAIPRQSGGASAYWVAEGANITESDQSFNQVSLKPKTVSALTQYSRKLLLQSSIDVEAFVRHDLTLTIALAIDKAAINGSGTGNEPTGILNTGGIGSVAGGTNGAAPTWQNIVDLESSVAAADADIGALAYLTNSKVRGKLKQTDKSTGGFAQFVWGDALADPGFGVVNGNRAAASNQVPWNLDKGTSVGVCSAIIFGNWADLIIGIWSGLDLIVDPYTNAQSGNVRIAAAQDVDIGIRHPESFAAMADALTT